MPVGVALTTPSTCPSAGSSASATLARPVPKRVTQRRDQPAGAPAVGVEHVEPLAPEAEQRVGDRRTGAAGADQQRPRQRGARQSAAEALGEAGAVRVVPDRAPVAQHHRVDGAERGRLVGQLVEVLEHELLARMGDVEPVEAGLAGLLEQVADVGRRDAELVDVEHAVGVGEAEAGGLVLVQRRAQRGADAGADEPDQVGAGSERGSVGTAIMYELVRY